MNSKLFRTEKQQQSSRIVQAGEEELIHKVETTVNTFWTVLNGKI